MEKRAPLTVKFEIPYFTVSGIQVRYLKIVEKSGYQALPWVRYITQNGDDYRCVTFRLPAHASRTLTSARARVQLADGFGKGQRAYCAHVGIIGTIDSGIYIYIVNKKGACKVSACRQCLCEDRRIKTARR